MKTPRRTTVAGPLELLELVGQHLRLAHPQVLTGAKVVLPTGTVLLSMLTVFDVGSSDSQTCLLWRGVW